MKKTFRPGLRLAPAATCLMAAAGLWSALHAWTTPERVDRRPEGYHILMPALAVAPDGGVHAVWSETPPPGYTEDKVMYARKDGDTWTIPVNISRDSGDIREPAISSDTLGNLAVVWAQDGTGLMRYVRQLGDTWSVAKPCFSQRGTIPRVATDSRGRTHMVFQWGGCWYSYFHTDADSWSTPIEIAPSPTDAAWARIAVDRFDHLHAVWMDYSTLAIGYAFNDGSGWLQPERLPDPDTTWPSADPAVAADTAGRPFVVWQEDSVGSWIYYSAKEGDSWSRPRRVYDLTGAWPVVATDTLDQVHVVGGRDDGLRYAVRTSAGWQQPYAISSVFGFPGEITRHASRLHLIWTQTQWSVWYSEHDIVGACEERGDQGVELGPIVIMGSAPVLTYILRESTPVTVELRDVAGRTVSRSAARGETSGAHRLQLARGDLSPGAYFAQVTIGSRTYALKAVVVR